MSKKQLYTVTITTEAVVYAESPDDAEKVAHKHREEIARTQGGLSAFEADPVDICARLPVGWDHRCLPYGGDGVATIGQILRGEVKP